MDVCRKLLKKNIFKKNASLDIYVIRMRSDNTLADSRPCKHCIICLLKLEKLLKIKIHNVYYSTIDVYIFCEKLQHMNPNTAYITSGERRRNKKI